MAEFVGKSFSLGDFTGTVTSYHLRSQSFMVSFCSAALGGASALLEVPKDTLKIAIHPQPEGGMKGNGFGRDSSPPNVTLKREKTLQEPKSIPGKHISGKGGSQVVGESQFSLGGMGYSTSIDWMIYQNRAQTVKMCLQHGIPLSSVDAMLSQGRQNENREGGFIPHIKARRRFSQPINTFSSPSYIQKQKFNEDLRRNRKSCVEYTPAFNSPTHLYPKTVPKAKDSLVTPASARERTRSKENAIASHYDMNEGMKVDLLRIIRGVYNEASSRKKGKYNFPEYEEIEARLEKAKYINISRLCILKARKEVALVLNPLRRFLPMRSECYVVNSLVEICPLCAARIFLSKLGLRTNVVKHLRNTHGILGGEIASRYECIENGEEKEISFSLSEEELQSSFATVTAPIDSCPLNSQQLQKGIIPLCLDKSIELSMLQLMMEDGVFSLETIVVQEILASALLRFGIAEASDFSLIFTMLATMQKKMNSASPEAFKLYLEAGHPCVLSSCEEKPSIGLEYIKTKTIDFLEKEGNEVHNNWILDLLSIFLQEPSCESDSILIDELRVFGYFYFGLITQRTPKKFSGFQRLLSYSVKLFNTSTKAYEIYVGEGPSGQMHTRGKPVCPSKEVLGNYNHYGLSKKSLQRVIKSKPELLGNVRRNIPLYENLHSCENEQVESLVGRKRGSLMDSCRKQRRRSSILEYVKIESTES